MDWVSIGDTGLSKDMSIKIKIESAKTDSWLVEGLTDEEIKESVKSAKAEKEAERNGIQSQHPLRQA